MVDRLTRGVPVQIDHQEDAFRGVIDVVRKRATGLSTKTARYWEEIPIPPTSGRRNTRTECIAAAAECDGASESVFEDTHDRGNSRSPQGRCEPPPPGLCGTALRNKGVRPSTPPSITWPSPIDVGAVVGSNPDKKSSRSNAKRATKAAGLRSAI